MQRVLFTDAVNPKVTATARAQVVRAWDVMEERKRILRMKPKPKDVEVGLGSQGRGGRPKVLPAPSENLDDAPKSPACCSTPVSSDR